MEYSVNSYTTISSLSEYEDQLNLSYNKLFLKSKIDADNNTLIVNSTLLTNKYYEYIQRSVVTLTMTNNEYMKYRYQPKLFCSDMYGTTELWALLLQINNFNSVTDFKHKKIKVFSPDIFNIINEILINEEKNILENYERVGL